MSRGVAPARAAPCLARCRGYRGATMLVSDVRHFLELPDEAPGPARKLGQHLTSIVRAATAEAAGQEWITALPCQRRPGRRPCPGHIAVFRADLPGPIEWWCDTCGDDGRISGWEDSYLDLKSRYHQTDVEPEVEIMISEETAATLRDLYLIDPDCEAVVFRMRSTDRGLVLSARDGVIEELLGFVAAEANHEEDRRRRKRLDAAFAEVSEAFEAVDA